MFKLLIKILKEFVFNHKFITSIILLLLSVSLLTVFLIFSISAGTVEQEVATNRNFRRFTLSYADGSSEFSSKDIASLSEKLDSAAKEISKYSSLKAINIISNSDESNLDIDAYSISYLLDPYIVYLGQGFRTEEFENEKRDIVISNLRRDDVMIGDTYTIGEYVYTVIGVSFETEHQIIYTPEILQELPVHKIVFEFDKAPDMTDKSSIKNVLQDTFPSLLVSQPRNLSVLQGYDPLLAFLYFALFILTLVNIIFTYSFILNKHKQTIVIMKICGCTNSKCIALLITEIIIVSLVAFIPTTAFAFWFVPKLTSFATSETFIYYITLSDSLFIFAVYIISIVSAFIPFLDKTVRKISLTTHDY